MKLVYLYQPLKAKTSIMIKKNNKYNFVFCIYAYTIVCIMYTYVRVHILIMYYIGMLTS